MLVPCVDWACSFSLVGPVKISENLREVVFVLDAMRAATVRVVTATANVLLVGLIGASNSSPQLT